MAFFNKQDNDWINDQVNIIYQHYEELKTCITNAKELTEGFHERYRVAIRTGLDLKVFLTNELAHVNKLKEHHRKQQEEAKEAHARKQKAQVVLQGEIDRIAVAYQHYPKSAFVNAKEFPELAHLYGAIDHFEHRYWHGLINRLRKEYALTGNSPLTLLEHDMQKFIAPQEKHEPQALLLFTQHYREHSLETEKYAMEAIKDVAFFLHSLHDLLNNLNFIIEEESYRYVIEMIEAFRLASIKKRSF